MPAGELVTDPVPSPAGVRLTCWRIASNVAVTVVGPVIDTVHTVGVCASGVHPCQPPNVEFAFGVAVRVTGCEAWSNGAEQVAPQSIPTGELTTAPPPAPAFSTRSSGVNVAVAERCALIVTRHVGAVPAQAPPQAENAESDDAVAVRATVEFAANGAVHPDDA